MSKRKETLSLDRSDKLSVQVLLALVESFTTAYFAMLLITGIGIAYASTFSEGDGIHNARTKNQFYEVSMECTTSNDWAGHQTE